MGYSTNGTRSWRESLDSPEFVLSDNLRVGEVYKVQCDLLTDREQTDQITCNIDLHAFSEQPWNVRVENFAPGLQKVTWSAPKINCTCPYLYVIEQRAMGDDSGHVKYMHVQSKQNQGKEDIQLDFEELFEAPNICETYEYRVYTMNTVDGRTNFSATTEMRMDLQRPRFTPNLTITWSAVDEVMVSWDLGCSTGLKFDVIAQSDVTELRRRILGEPGLPEYTKLRVSACMSYLVYLDFLVGELRSPSNFLVLNGSFKITMKQIKAENIDTSVQRISWEELPDDSWCAEDVYQVTQTQESEKMIQAHNLSFGETFEPGRPVRVSASFIEPGRLSVRWLPPNTSLEITAFEFIVTALSISDAKADVRYNISSLSAITMSVAHCTDYMVYVQTCDVRTGEISERSTGVLVMSQTPNDELRHLQLERGKPLFGVHQTMKTEIALNVRFELFDHIAKPKAVTFVMQPRFESTSFGPAEFDSSLNFPENFEKGRRLGNFTPESEIIGKKINRPPGDADRQQTVLKDSAMTEHALDTGHRIDLENVEDLSQGLRSTPQRLTTKAVGSA
ncbi:hypothetical protein CLF_106132 [Clonorchis sinensis]|uniref:Fibronectin type-III domain-containing protein n=1 Tax=Clonorchis sinensis TaxID=79923 RepID=G7YPP3_CLOSI|nr:hypothetical protein CLF_106132 [Clonorchis sinensis]